MELRRDSRGTLRKEGRGCRKEFFPLYSGKLSILSGEHKGNSSKDWSMSDLS